MSRIIKGINREVLRTTAARCRDRNIIIPTFEQLRHPDRIPARIRQHLPNVGLWDVNPLNLFRITWKNDLRTGGYGPVNHIEIPSEISGVRTRILGLVGKLFPTGSHKVGAAFGCLVPRLVSGQFDPARHRAVWPSTGNYCRGGAFDCALLGCTAVAILPEEMSRERFEWLKGVGAEVIATPGCESNVKEVFDKCRELKEDPANVILNQFDEFGNSLYHHSITGPAIEEVFQGLGDPALRFRAFVSASGSAGTFAAGDYLRGRFPGVKTVVAEALQCPTLTMCGFGGHRIEGIGDKHVPWIHNARGTDAVTAIDDEDCIRIMRLFNEKAGAEHLRSLGVDETVIDGLPMLGISSICNLLAAIKAAKYFEMDEKDIIITVFTDSMEMYQSRLQELARSRGVYDRVAAARDFEGPLGSQRIDFFKELDYYERKAIHNLKYYTWIEQQGKTSEELLELWNPDFWRRMYEDEVGRFDHLIEEFNREVGLLQ